MRRLALLAVLALLAGCGGDSDDDTASPGGSTPTGTAPAPTTATDPEPEPAQSRVAVYFIRGEKLGVGARQAEGEAVARAAVEALLAGPSDEERDAGLTTEIPDGTELLDLAVADGTATVDLSGAFDDGGGSASMQARVAQVVATLTQFPSIERVAFRLDGEPVTAIGGEGVAVDPPLGRERHRGADARDPGRVARGRRDGLVAADDPRHGEHLRGQLPRVGHRRRRHDALRQLRHGNVRQRRARHVRRDVHARGRDRGPVTLTVWEDNQSSGEGGTPPKLHVVEIPLVLAD